MFTPTKTFVYTPPLLPPYQILRYNPGGPSLEEKSVCVCYTDIGIMENGVLEGGGEA